MFKRLILLVKPYAGRLVLAAVTSLLVSATNGGLAWLVKPALDGLFVKKDATLLVLLPLGVLVLYFLKGLFSFLQAYLMKAISAKVVRDIRNRLYAHLLALPVDEFKKESSGALLSRTINDASVLQNVLANGVRDLFVETATAVALIAVAFYRRWDLALIAVTVLPLSLNGVKRLGKRLKKVSDEGQKKISLITELLTETFSGIKMVKVFGKEGALRDLFVRKNQDYYREIMRSVRISEGTSLMMDTVGALGISFVLWYGGRLVIVGEMSAGDFFSFLTALLMIYTPAKRIANASNNIQQAKAVMERLDELLIRQGEKDGLDELPPLSDRIEFRDVGFKYPTSRDYVLKDVSMTVLKGEIVAIVGRSGAGKTSLVDLIPRFYDPLQGSVLIDGKDIATVSLRSLRDQVGLVSQDVILFNDTVRANISFGKPDASEDEIVGAAKAAYAHDFIMNLPQGYDTLIGERGVMISGGQRQRLSIARAILKNPPILILDEATSALDTESEMMLQKALDSLMAERTTIVIAHRLSTIKKADRIIVLEKGMIVEAGSHETLLQGDGIYRRLHDLQASSEEMGQN
ncbi:MAG: ABC transporter ATP-binding protein [Nitrospirales bacterium]|nr:ABC transporter ATP-binding protein [Nitrospirales bacterium]